MLWALDTVNAKSASSVLLSALSFWPLQRILESSTAFGCTQAVEVFIAGCVMILSGSGPQLSALQQWNIYLWSRCGTFRIQVAGTGMGRGRLMLQSLQCWLVIAKHAFRMKLCTAVSKMDLWVLQQDIRKWNIRLVMVELLLELFYEHKDSHDNSDHWPIYYSFLLLTTAGQMPQGCPHLLTAPWHPIIASILSLKVPFCCDG